MTNWKPAAALIVIAIVIGLGLQLWYWTQLPERIATHFDAQGKPDGWMDKRSATLLFAGLVTFLPLFFVGIGLMIRSLPTSSINLPNREYWLSAERRDETLRWMNGWMMWFAVSITIFLVTINHLTFIANRDAQPLSAIWFWGMLATFLVSTAGLIVLMWRRFAKPT
ncbi:MAG: DUF1648 domain-containing protein [Pirellulaceae bacterium]|nr:DUF1648 domain-containing protein [Pirellulaceae bacterium]